MRRVGGDIGQGDGACHGHHRSPFHDRWYRAVVTVNRCDRNRELIVVSSRSTDYECIFDTGAVTLRGQSPVAAGDLLGL